ncbi:MAG: hypothetical protein M0Z71_06975, partial [Nitrospiraceae bacterium]|nr:hypothetical protein [Nitrospiraceae bacterium]
MDDLKGKSVRKFAYFIPLAVLLGIVALVLRGPYLSNALKKAILPELELMTGERVIAQKIYVNLFPLFVEANGLKVFDDKGTRILVAPRVKAYVELSGVPAGQIKIRRLVLKRPEVTTDRIQASQIIEHVKAYLAKERDTAFKVKIRAVEVQEGRGLYQDAEEGMTSGVEGLQGEILIGETQRIRASAKRVSVSKKGWPDLSAEADMILAVKDETVIVKKLTMGALGSTLTGEGGYSGGKADLRTDIHLLINTVKKIFGLRRPGEGEVTAKGVLQYVNHVVSADMKVDGKFFIQTVMELLKVKEKVEGLVDIKASLKGPLNSIKGDGTIIMTDGNLFDVDVKRLKCKVSYGDGVMRFTEGAGTLYNGSAKMSASINLPVVNSYTVDVAFADVDSRPIFKLIGWDPGVPPGKVSGDMSTSGATFNPAGRFEYRSVESGKDVLGRIRNISGRYRMEGPLLTLADLRLRTGISEITADGTADIEKKSLDFAGRMRTPDVTDLTSPYYIKLKGAAAFRGRITGTFGDPVLGGEIEILNPVYEQYAADVIETNIVYRKDKLDITDMTVRGKGQSATLSGSVAFRGAKELFDLARPEFKLSATIKNADLDRFARIFYPKFIGYGRLHSDIRI